MTIVEMSAGGAVLIAAVLLLRRCLLHRLPKWTFLLLWAVALCRLLIPFTLPSQLSVYTGAARIAQMFQEEEEPPTEVQIPVLTPPVNVPGTFREDIPVLPAAPTASVPEREPVSPLAVVWLTGTALCGLFFGAAYLWTLRRFWDAVPAEAEFLTRWREEHPTPRAVQVRTCGAVNAPVAYGLIRSVILLPENTDWTDENQLTYILTHEYVHIRRGDLLWKLLLTAALCVHWFNPLVWAMYFCANRDLELACDEAVVRILGLEHRKDYAYALLSAAESGFSPLCLTYTTKNHMEERIRAIMKLKKRSVAAILTAALLVAGVTAVFATSKAPPKDISDLPQAVQTSTDPKPASGNKSTPEITPPASDGRVHPVTGQPAENSSSAAIQPSVDIDADPKEVALDEYGRPIISFDPDEPAKSWGLPDGPIARGVVLNFHTEEEYRESIRLLRLRGYRGSFALTGGGNDRYIVILDEDYDGVVHESKAPEGFMPDWTYPVNSKGETYGTFGMRGWVGYDPDLVAVQATNGATGYMEYNYGYTGVIGSEDYREWMAAKPNPFKVPVYDVNRDNIVGYFEVGHQTSVETQNKIEELTGQENRWNVPDNPIPEGTEITVSTEDEMEALCDYLHDVRGIQNADLAIKPHSEDGPYTVIVGYFMTKQEEEAKARLANGYPVNAKGETYGTGFDSSIMGYEPDLISVAATNGKRGYSLKADYEMFDEFVWAEQHGGDPAKFDEWFKLIEECKEWKKTQPYIVPIPVYDVDRTKVVGYFNIYNATSDDYNSNRSQEDIELELKTVEDALRRHMGLSEEEIAKELEALKQSKGWSS